MKFFLLRIIGYIIGLISIILSAIFMTGETFYEKNLNSPQIELLISGRTDVLGQNGSLNLVGWTRSAKDFSFNKSLINPSTSSLFSKDFNKYRYKKWEALMFTSEKFIFLFAPFDVSYLSGYLLHWADLSDPNSEIESTWYRPFSDKVTINDECLENCLMYNYENKLPDSSLKLAKFSKTTGNTFHFEADFDDKARTKFTLNVVLKREDSADSISTLTPISEDRSLFYYNLKQNGINLKGNFNFNDKEYNLENFIATYDSGRGVWPVKSGWIWVNGNGRTSSGLVFGINIGHGFSHPEASNTTEDCFFINNKVFKLPAMHTELLNNSHSKPWKFTVSQLTNKENLTGNRCDIKFEPLKKKWIGENLIVGKLSFNIYYGQFVGICIDIEGNEYQFEKVYGIIEDKKSIW